MRRLVSSLGLVMLLAGAGVTLHALRDRHQFVDQPRLQAALLIFRPAEQNGTAKPVDAAGLSPGRSTRADPARCRSLALLNSGEARDGGSWQGVNGSPVEPVTTLTARFATAGQARAELRAKRAALLRCRTVRLTFPPFADPAEAFSVGGRAQLTLLGGDTLSYTLTGTEQRYAFYLRRWGNTLTWAYGSTESRPATRQQVVDDLARTLAELAAEER